MGEQDDPVKAYIELLREMHPSANLSKAIDEVEEEHERQVQTHREGAVQRVHASA